MSAANPAPMPERLWRIRKSHSWMDARLAADEAGCHVEFFYGATRLCARRFPTRALAEADAQSTLRDLLRAGWTTHW